MIIDLNIHYGYWPKDTWKVKPLNAFLKDLKKAGIKGGFISPLEAIFSFDPDIHNRELINKIKCFPEFKVLPIINPKAKNCITLIKNYAKEKINIIKIAPTYQRYSLMEKDIRNFLKTIAEENLTLVIQKRFEDERTRNPIITPQNLEIEEIEKIAKDFSDLRIIVLCLYIDEAIKLAKNTNIYMDISFIEHLDTLGTLIKHIPVDRIVFGSHTPFLYPESAVFKLKYSSLKYYQRKKIASENLIKLLRS